MTEPGRRPGRALFAEAGLALTTARIAVRFVAFRRLMRSVAPRLVRPASLAEIAILRRAILAWPHRLPLRALCFEQGLAAHWLLSRRRISSTIHYGAAMVGGELKAHVWVMSGEIPVIGCDNAADFALLSCFSNDSSS